MKTTHNPIYRIVIALLCMMWCVLPTMAAPKYVVVIDAGHGGKDCGAMDNGVSEKDINLKVALKLGDYIKKNNKNIKVVYTRDKDEYLTLQQRADKANKAKGDLFISIHTNSVDKSNPNRKTVEGASTYTLGLHKNDNNMSVARRENSVMTLENNYTTSYNGFDPNSDESYIIFEMAQKANMANSVKFAEQVQKQLTKQAGRKDRGVHQAGFWVLWATSMPSVLVELDFICNPKSAEFISSDNGASQLAKGIGTATIAYFKALEQHNKNRLRTEETETGKPAEGFASAEEGVVLAAAAEEVKKSIAPQPAERTRRPANRRRRSDASRERSERQEYAEAVIQEEQAYIDHSPVSTVNPEPIAENLPKETGKKSKKDKGKKKTNNTSKPKAAKPSPQQIAQASGTASTSSAAPKPKAKAGNTKAKISGKELSTASGNKQKAMQGKRAAAASQDISGKSPARLSKVTTVYKIQILTSEERLKAGNPLFQGLSPVTCILEDNTYKYLYGESTNRNEIYHLLSDVQKKIPDAQVIKVKKAL